jgi:hypothetical protein
MERLTIQIPERKSKLIKSLLKELGAVIEPDLFIMARELNSMVGNEDKPSLEEIVNESRIVRAKS